MKKMKNRSKESPQGHVTYFWNFGTPSISWERLKVESRNLSRRLTQRGVKLKCKIRSIWVVRGPRAVLLEFWDPLYIPATVEARNFKLGMQIDHNEGVLA